MYDLEIRPGEGRMQKAQLKNKVLQSPFSVLNPQMRRYREILDIKNVFSSFFQFPFHCARRAQNFFGQSDRRNVLAIAVINDGGADLYASHFLLTPQVFWYFDYVKLVHRKRLILLLVLTKMCFRTKIGGKMVKSRNSDIHQWILY